MARLGNRRVDPGNGQEPQEQMKIGALQGLLLSRRMTAACHSCDPGAAHDNHYA